MLTGLLISAKVHSQNQQIIWSQEFVESKGDRMGNILHDSGTETYVFVYTLARGKKITPGIIKFDSQMKPLIRKDYSASIEKGTDVFMLGMFYCGGRFVLLTYIDDKATMTRKVFATVVDKVTLDPLQPAEEIWSYVYDFRNMKLNVGYGISPDSSLFVLTTTSWDGLAFSTTVQKSDMRYLTFKAFNSELKSVNERNALLNFPLLNVNIKDFVLCNDGTMVYASKDYNVGFVSEYTKNASKVKVANYNAMIRSYPSDGSNQEVKIDLGTSLLNNISLAPDPTSGDMIVFNTYNDIDNEFLTGYGYLKFKTGTGEIVANKKLEFTQDIVKSVADKEALFKEQKGKLYIPKFYSINFSKVTEDGRVYLVLENNMVSGTEYTSQGTITMLHDLSGVRKWINYIPKLQVFVGKTDYMYCTYIIKKDKIILLYNEHDNIKTSDPIEPKQRPRIFNSWVSSILMKAEIDNEGKMNRSIFGESKNMGTPIRIDRSKQGAQNRFFLYGWQIKEDTYKIGLVNFE